MNWYRITGMLAAITLAGTAVGQSYEDARLMIASPGNSDFLGWSVAATEDQVLVGAPNHDGAGPNAGMAFLYRRTSHGWTLAQELRSWNAGKSQQFGRHVSLNDEYAVMPVHNDVLIDGGPFYTGAVYVFRREVDQWVPDARIPPHIPDDLLGFGWLAAVAGNLIFVSHHAHVDVYQCGAIGWKPAGRVGAVASSMASDGRTLAVGNAIDNVVTLHERVGTDWVQVATLDNPDYFDIDDDFGWSIAIEGDTLVVGKPIRAPITPRPGTVYVYRRGDSGWQLAQKMKRGFKPQGSDLFGAGIALRSSKLAVSLAPPDETQEGVRIYEPIGKKGKYVKTDLLKVSDGLGFSSIGMADSFVVLGVPHKDGRTVDDAGAAYVFDRSLGTVYCRAAPNSATDGATLVAKGSLAAEAGALRLEAAGLPARSHGFFLASRSRGVVTAPGGGDGTLCLGSPAALLAPAQAAGLDGTMGLAVDMGAIPLEPPAAVLPGETWCFQLWYRDEGRPSRSSSNLSEALSVTFR